MKVRRYEVSVGGVTALEINGIEDHVHLIVKLKPTKRFGLFAGPKIEVVGLDEGERHDASRGSAVKGAFTVSGSQRDIARRYIQNQ